MDSLDLILWSQKRQRQAAAKGKGGSSWSSYWTTQNDPLVRYYFDAGTGNEVVDMSGNGHNITIQDDATTPEWGNGCLIFSPTTYLISPVLPIPLNGSWTLMLSMSDTGALASGAAFSIGTRDSDWRYLYLTHKSLSGAGVTLSENLPHSTNAILFITQDATSGKQILYRPDTGEKVERVENLASAKNIQLSWGIALRIALYRPTDGCEVAYTAAWTRCLTEAEMASEVAHEVERLERAKLTFPMSVNDVFDRANTELGSIGTSTSGWKWDYRNALGWGFATTEGRIYNNQWVCEGVADVAYASVILKTKVKNIGATFSFNGVPADYSVFTIAACLNDNWVNNMIHILISPIQLSVTAWDGVTQHEIIFNSLTLAIGGTQHNVTVTISGDVVTVNINGTSYSGNSEYVGQFVGRNVFFEQSNGSTSFVQIHRMYAQ